MPQLLSIQVGLPAEHGADAISNKSWQSGIFKFPVTGRIHLDSTNLAGDGQDDLKNHGGPYRAVLAYNAAHYDIWREELNLPDLPYGAFGENFTVSGLDEETICIGDIYAIGEVQLEVAQPRMPCWKLARRWGIKDLTARVDVKAWGGWYHRVLQEGEVEAGLPITLIARPYPKFTISYIYKLMNDRIESPDAMEDMAALADVAALSPGWRRAFVGRIEAEEEA